MKSASNVYADLYAALAAGTTVITANRRLANFIRAGFDTQMQDQGKSCWPSADVLPLASWLIRRWDHLQDHDYLPTLELLSDYHCLLMWESIINQNTAGLLNVRAAAKQALQAWQLTQLWDLDWQQPEHGHNDFVIWQQWAEQFHQYCQQRQCLDHSQLARMLTQAHQQQTIETPASLMLVGLDEIPTQLACLLDEYSNSGCDVQINTPGIAESKIQSLGLTDTHAEIQAIANWAKQTLTETPTARIACIVPNLPDLREQITRVFDQVFYPQSCLRNQPEYQPIYDLSAGQSLLTFPIIHCAWLVLRLGQNKLNLSDAGVLLRSPFIGDAEQETGNRANIDAVLHEYGADKIALSTLLQLTKTSKRFGFRTLSPQLHECLLRLQQTISNLPGKTNPSRWANIFAKQLSNISWPGSRSLDSHEYQVVQRLQQVFDEFAGLDNLLGEITHSQALYQWQQLVQSIVFQFKISSPKIHILGALEAVGLHFDATWIMGLHDHAWPASIKPNPFIPLHLQRSANLPQSSAKRELAFTQQLTQRLVHSAPNVILSYPQTDGDNPLRISPLLTEYETCQALPKSLSISRQLYGKTQLEYIHDEQAPPLKSDETIRGGSSIFKLQAACPFKAFASLRLKAQGLTEIQQGLDAIQRGNLIHRCLELIWQQLGDHETLLSFEESSLHGLLAHVISNTLREFKQQDMAAIPNKLLDLEQQRLQQLLIKWLELEKTRPAFKVIATEQRSKIKVADLSVNVMIDRIDQVNNQNIIVDYKTGNTSLHAWFGDRPDEPQLPLYCITSETPVHGLLFAQVRADKLQFKGILQQADLVPNATACDEFNSDDGEITWHQLQQDWYAVLNQLAHDYSQGVASVDPKDGYHTCQYCELSSLCRIGETDD